MSGNGSITNEHSAETADEDRVTARLRCERSGRQGREQTRAGPTEGPQGQGPLGAERPTEGPHPTKGGETGA